MDELLELRRAIDALDAEIVARLADRLRVVERIATLKASRQLRARDPEREAELASRWAQYAGKAGLAPGDAQRLLEAVLGLSRPIVEREVPFTQGVDPHPHDDGPRGQ